MSAEVSFDRDQPDGKARSAIHFQLGKMYPYATELAPETLNLIRAVKAQLDPDHLMNPGALGL
jgi:D-lactate dehydrogenase (cytochrome)